ncbi:MAG: TIGR00296 family protein [archaeon]
MEKLSLKEAEQLIKLARKSIKYFLVSGRTMQEIAPEKFSEKQGVFVSLHEFPSKELRGCIGFPNPVMPLWNAVIDAAVSAAFNDPRFKELEAGELEKVVLEISVLTVPEEIKEKKELIPKKIRAGEDGLIVKMNRFSGLLLPQVALAWNWNSIQFLEETCIKAGLEKEAWKKEDCKIFKFRAQIFKEKKPEGKTEET